MTGHPYVTGPIDHYDTQCAYGIYPDDPNPRCEEKATWHICLLALDLVTVHTIGACDEHYPLAKGIAGDRFVQQHVYEELCAWPGVLWSMQENRCVLDDSGTEQSAREAAEVSA